MPADGGANPFDMEQGIAQWSKDPSCFLPVVMV